MLKAKDLQVNGCGLESWHHILDRAVPILFIDQAILGVKMTRRVPFREKQFLQVSFGSKISWKANCKYQLKVISDKNSTFQSK
jgi:hypothetical protein